MMPPETRFDEKVEGAAAVMPTVRRTASSLVLKDAHQAALRGGDLRGPARPIAG